MKTKIIYKDFQINNVAMERLVFDDKVKDRHILLDDVNEKRWKITIKTFQAMKITTVDCANLNYGEDGDFDDACYIESENHPIFRRFIMEVEDSKWIKELKSYLRKVDPYADFMDKARHFLLPLYDNIIEIIAWDIELSEI